MPSYEPRIARGHQKVDEETIQARIRAQAALRAKNMTFAEQLMEEDKRADDELFSMIKIATMKRTLALEEKPTITITTTTTPSPIRLPIALPIPSCRALSPLRHSSPESSSGSDSDSDSGSDSGFSYTSKGSSVSSLQSSTSAVQSTKKYVPPHHYTRSSPQPYSGRKVTRSRIFVDSTKTQVTPYDGGKTTVLTGGVMLGGASSSKNGNGRRWRRVSVRI